MLTIALAKGIAVLGILLLLRAGQVTFGHALYVAFGAYTVAFLGAARAATRWCCCRSPPPAPALLGLVVGLFVTRYRQIFFGMLNLAMSHGVLLAAGEALRHHQGHATASASRCMPIAGQALDRVAYEWTIFGIALGLAFVLRRAAAAVPRLARWARRWPASRRARRGSNSWACRRAACCSRPMSLSALVGGIGGALIAMTSRHVTPLLAYWTSSGELVFIAILGGAGGVLGPFLGAAAYRAGARLCRGVLSPMPGR